MTGTNLKNKSFSFLDKRNFSIIEKEEPKFDFSQYQYNGINNFRQQKNLRQAVKILPQQTQPSFNPAGYHQLTNY